MKILVIGDAGSIFIKQYIEYVLLDGKNQVVLIEENALNSDYKSFYDENNVIIEPLWNKKWSFLRNIPRVRSMIGVPLWCSYIKKKYGEFDLVHIHGVSRSRGDIALNMRDSTKKMIVSVWGDEIFRNNAKILADFEKYYKCADRITMATKKMYDTFISVYGEKYADVISINKFAIGLFDKIDNVKVQYSREELCDFFGIEHPEKITVFVGHNGREAQRHIEITKVLSNLSKEYLEKITLVYTMTYGVKSQQYLDEMLTVAKKLGCDIVVLKEFMNEDTAARLRNICDVLLHAQLTDGFSASIQESLYSGSIILNGSWLPYEELPDYKDCMIEYDHIEDIPKILMDVLENYKTYKSKFVSNRETLRSISSLEITTQKWNETIKLTVAEKI